MLGTVAAVGVGAVAGMLVAEAAEAASHHRGQRSDWDTMGNQPVAPPAEPDLDLGGAIVGDVGWSADSSDVGGVDFGSAGDDFS